MLSKLELWNRQLELQVELTIQEDIEYLQRLPEFRRSKRILEIGCGNGIFLSGIARSFTDKTFVGIDINEKLLASAYRRSARRENLRFQKRDIYEIECFDTKFDFIIIRLVVQHLKDLEGFLQICSRLLRRSGSMLIIEALDAKTTFSPGVPEARQLFGAIRRTQPKGGPERALNLVIRHAGGHDLHIMEDGARVYKTQAESRAKTKVVSLFSNLAALAPLAFDASADRKKLQSELRIWQLAEGSCFQFGFRFVLLRKRGPTFYQRLCRGLGLG
jgi:ubiquinone/menaquinone biosynthesis C-methylase UbiE